MSRSAFDEAARRLAKMDDEQRYRVRERAGIIWDGCPGTSWESATQQALAEEDAQLTLRSAS